MIGQTVLSLFVAVAPLGVCPNEGHLRGNTKCLLHLGKQSHEPPTR